MLMALHQFVFELATIPYQQLQRSRAWRHPANPRVGKRPSRQFIGPGDDIIKLEGTLYPELTGGRVSMMTLTDMADTGDAWPLLDGSGIYYGLWIIESVEETHRLFFSDGAARKIDFSIKLTRVDDGATNLVGSARIDQ